jgi:hypothetical protein
MIPLVKKGIQLISSPEKNMPASPAVSAVRAASRHILLSPEADAPPSAITSFYIYLYIINKLHGDPELIYNSVISPSPSLKKRGMYGTNKTFLFVRGFLYTPVYHYTPMQKIEK